MSHQSSSSPTIICCWSGPRCVSTSLMYSFAQRSDTTVFDEPLYGAFLSLTGAERPYTDLVLASQNPDGNAAVEDILSKAQGMVKNGKSVVYMKHMAKHRVAINKSLLTAPNVKHFLLVREPLAVVSSFNEVVPPNLMETCYTALLDLYSELRSLGNTPTIILSDDLVKNPEATLCMLCKALDVDFDPAMLRWPAGPKPEIDGVWAPWWYARTHTSTGFEPPPPSSATNSNTTTTLTKEQQQEEESSSRRKIDETLLPLLEECQPLWEFLKQKALRPTLPTQPTTHLPATATAITAKGGGGVDSGTHAHNEDARNKSILIGMRDGVTGDFDLVHRNAAKVSVFESGYMLGDGVWEGLRVTNGTLLFAQKHFDRLFEGAKAIDMRIGLSRNDLQNLVYKTVDANGMKGGVHIRLMVTRGLKSTCYQNPKVTIGQPTIVIIPEYKAPPPTTPSPTTTTTTTLETTPSTTATTSNNNNKGIKLFTCHVRRSRPDTQNPGLNSHSKLNCITACIQANKAGADEALMLDPQGFVCTANSTNFFIVRKGEVWTATTKYLMPGITRANILELCRRNGIVCRELDFSLTEVYGAEEAFVTGTFAGLTAVCELDGRVVGDGGGGDGKVGEYPVIERLKGLYKEMCLEESGRGRVELH